MIGDTFKQWIKGRIEERNQKLADQKNLMISVDPEIARIFNDSNFISCKYIKIKDNGYNIIVICIIYIESNGSGAHLLKVGTKRRRT